jgi:hypothetical protein
MIKTFEEARLLIRELKICTIFDSSKTELPSLWEHIDLPEKREGETGWGQKVTAQELYQDVWDLHVTEDGVLRGGTHKLL